MNQLKRPSTISGYVHPKIHTYSKSRVYKTFTTDTNEKFSDASEFNNTEVGKQYAQSYLEEEVKCGVCSGKVAHSCPCAYSDKTCVNGHKWYTARDGKICMGDPHIKK